MGNSTYANQQALENPETLATVIHAVIKKQYGEQVFEWDPVTVYLEAQADFKADMDAAAMDRWSAIQIVMTTDVFFKRIDAFMGISNTLASGAPFFATFDPVTVEEAAWAITEVSLNRELLPFSYTVRQYLKQILTADGYSEGDYPVVFAEVFQVKPRAEDIRKELAGVSNRNNVEAFIDDQLADLVSQFNEIPDLKDLDNIILNRSMDEFVGTVEL